MSRARRSLLALLASLPLAASASEPAGTPPKDAAQAFASADVVFLGEVESVSPDKLGFPSVAKVRVRQTWKGQDRLARSVVVDGSGGPTYPARLFKEGTTYLFYLPGGPAPLRADSYLHRVLQVSEAGEDLRFLDQKK